MFLWFGAIPNASVRMNPASRKNLIPRDIRDLVQRLNLRGPLFYAGTLNGEPNGYRSIELDRQSGDARSAPERDVSPHAGD
jgi:hypothetical protein